MSFDIQFNTCNLGLVKKQICDPFTGRPVEVFMDEGLSDGERIAITELLADVKAECPSEATAYLITLPDGGEIELYFDALDGSRPCNGGMAVLHRLTADSAALLFKLGQVGNLIMTPIMERPVNIVIGEEQRRRILQCWPDAIVINSAAGLRELLENGMIAWRSYRDRAVDS